MKAAVAMLLGAVAIAALARDIPPLTIPPLPPGTPPEMRLEPLPGDAPSPADNPPSKAKAALGRLLFFDPVLSATQDVSCATCHNPRFGWTDGRTGPIGVGGTGLGPERLFHSPTGFPPLLRNAPSILNTGFNGLVAGAKINPTAAPMFWDSRVQSLERQVLFPLTSREEMRGTSVSEAEAIPALVARVRNIPEYRRMFGEAFAETPGGAVTISHLAQAISAFERTLITPNSPFDRYLRGEPSAISDEQRRGLEVFQQAGCIQCHGGPMFSDFKLHFIGVSDSTSDGRREFRTPTLRNLRSTAPYMHNGSLRTIGDVSVFYEALSDTVSETLDGGDESTQPRLDPLLKRLNLRVEDFPSLEAFLDTLNDDTYDRSAPPTVPSGLQVAIGR